MDWNKVIKFAKAQGYAGKEDDAEAVKSFLASKSLVLADAEGKDLDLGAVLKAHTEAKTKAVEPRRVVLDTADDVEVEKEEERVKSRARGAAAVHGATADEPVTRSGFANKAARKAYERKIDSGEAAFADADSAEFVAAMIRSSIFKSIPYSQKANDLAIIGKSQVEFDNTLGGYLVPVEYVPQLLYLTEPYGVARKLANVNRMSGEVRQFPRKTAIPTMNWESETQSSTAQNVNVDMVELIARKLKAVINSSTELLEDSAINVADMIATSVREGYDIAIDNTYFLGDATSTYGGYRGLATALPSSAYINGSGAWSAFTTADFNKAFGSLQNANGGRLSIVCSRQFYHQVCIRLDKATSQFKNLTDGPSADGSFLGFPVYFSQVMPTATGSSVKSCYIGDFAAASMIGERRDLAIASSEHALFSNDMIQWRATARAAINIHGDGRGSTYGPIVSLVATA